ncbi:fructosamine kinase family protein [Lacticaseibacillus porcinae]|uniref:fructosamine kinase family protein n=1 Tax=Lacticaseibacillus porcinae TaxID=1123687 RepID=UPI000F7B662A|nr:fructosamine kinase family protein [Lacticaseibacillus porcinae]
MDKKWLSKLPLPEITNITPIGGGDVNVAYHVETAKQDYFLLVQADQPASFYAGEVAGLKAFQQADITAPHVIAHGQIYGDAYLVLDFLPQGSGSQADLGHLVAQLHQVQSPTERFGFSQPYAGTSVSFANAWSDSWTQSFVNQRLDVLDASLLKKQLWAEGQRTQFLTARANIIETLAHHHSQPVLLHGDLWSGNFIFLQDGRPALIDPAAWYGDREFDVGITTVFGGFTSDFYRGYVSQLPLDDGFDQRQHFYRLYYLMVHLDKFGITYQRAVQIELNAINQQSQ